MFSDSEVDDACEEFMNGGTQKPAKAKPAKREPYKAASSIIRRKQVERKTGLSRSSIYSYMEAGTFPKPVNLGPRAVGWVEAEIDQWIDDRIKESRS